MKLDLRIPMGLMFTFIGAILTIWGIKTNDNVALYTLSLAININLRWGLVLLAFGIIIYILGQRSRSSPAQSSQPQLQKKTKRRKP